MPTARSSARLLALKKADSGFSLIELLIVVAIILIIAAIAIPNLLRARISANEASAASSVRNISRAEVSYYASYPTDGYPTSLSVLGGPITNCLPTDTQACLIDPVLAAGQKSGYQFLVTALMPSGGVNTAFVVGASPLVFNSTGSRDFCATNDGVVRAKTGSSGDVPVNDIPPCAAFLPIQ